MAVPELSVVVAGSRASGPPARLFEALEPELRSGRVEVVLASARAPASFGPRAGVRILGLPPGTTVPRLRAAGLREARAPIVALTEDFCVPCPEWASRMLAVHALPGVVAVGGPVRRTSGRARDWALTLCEYGRFLAEGRAGPVADFPGVNASYRLAGLEAALGEVPDEIFEVETHARLRAAGATMLWEPRAVVDDVNDKAFLQAVSGFFHHGRLFGARRVCGRRWERVFRAFLAPLVPAIQGARLVKAAWAAGVVLPLLRSALFTGTLLSSWAIGEGVGSLFGEGDSARRWT